MGSSPLTRGKPHRRDDRSRHRRLIPAHAGKTFLTTWESSKRTAHPRSRGENPTARASLSRSGGSSPLTRGKPCLRLILCRCSGLIPAHAGKTHVRGPQADGAEAHPRSRGENVVYCLSASAVAGSSPLTRGKRTPAYHQGARERLIPAHAGKTKTDPGLYGQTAAHPRSRGENLIKEEAIRAETGSSPLTRGKPRSHTSV